MAKRRGALEIVVEGVYSVKASDYIVETLIEHGISDVFGYPGGMVTHLMDSFNKYRGKIRSHMAYNEQGAAFAACGYAQTALKCGVAFATSGPGATNLITGIANAYFDSIPVLFITGQVNTYESKGDLGVRQRGFQEMDVVSVVAPVTKYTAYVDDVKDLPFYLDKAINTALSGRPGPCLLDIPMNIQRGEVDGAKRLEDNSLCQKTNARDIAANIYEALSEAKRPCVLVGAGLKTRGAHEIFREWAGRLNIPVVASMIAFDIAAPLRNYYGFVGAYGHRCANLIVSKSDLIIALGSRLDSRQTGTDTNAFAPGSKLIRVDIDWGELTKKVKSDERAFVMDIKHLLPALNECPATPDFRGWLSICDSIKEKVSGLDSLTPNRFVRELSKLVGGDFVITTDVGQNQVWVAQSFECKGQLVLFSGGHGAMGYSLPAAIGAHYGSGKKIVSINGDGGLQMNIQELQFLKRENIPIKIVLLNNKSLGMIRHFQEMYFNGNYTQTIAGRGYEAPDFEKLSAAYGIDYIKISDVSGIAAAKFLLDGDNPAFIELEINEDTYVYPKLAMGKPVHDQDPPLERGLFDQIESM